MNRAVAVVGVGCLTLLGGLTGCKTDPLLPDMPRSPYGRYQALRGGEPPQTEPDSFGVERPALRARLQPMDRP